MTYQKMTKRELKRQREAEQAAVESADWVIFMGEGKPEYAFDVSEAKAMLELVRRNKETRRAMGQ